MDFNCRCVHKIAQRPDTLGESNAISLLSDRRVQLAAGPANLHRTV